jgi:predicted ATP-dependent serine protease
MGKPDDHLEHERGAASANVGDASTPLLGRERELERLHANLTRMLDGRGHVALLHGEPGIGKIRLCKQVINETTDAALDTTRSGPITDVRSA